MEIKDLINMITVNDKKFDYFLSQIRASEFTCGVTKSKPCVGCVDFKGCQYCFRHPSLLTINNIVFITDKDVGYYAYEFIIKLLSCMDLPYEKVGIVSMYRTDDEEDEPCIINNINAEVRIHKPIKYVCISDHAYYKIIELGYEIKDNKIIINDKEIPFVKILDIHTLANDYENSKSVFINQLFNVMKE